MIRPTKYLDLNTCVLRVAAILLTELKLSQVVPLNELDALICQKAGDSARFNFLPALSFLFLAGVIDYDDDTDTILMLRDGLEKEKTI